MFLRDNLRNLYIPGFPTLMESFFIQESLLMRYLPKVSQHLVIIKLFFFFITLPTKRGILIYIIIQDGSRTSK
jgi:hypothetical protein